MTRTRFIRRCTEPASFAGLPGWLSAMLYAKGEQGTPPGVLMTRNGISRREPARPLPERDQWFERVWKKYREEQAVTNR